MWRRGGGEPAGCLFCNVLPGRRRPARLPRRRTLACRRPSVHRTGRQECRAVTDAASRPHHGALWDHPPQSQCDRGGGLGGGGVGVSFNPCFNGLSYLTSWPPLRRLPREGFNPCFNGLSYLTCACPQRPSTPCCFNPCFNGLSYLTRHMSAEARKRYGFNPCFNGLSYLTDQGDRRAARV